MDAIFNMYKVRFSKLDELITKHCTEMTRNSKVNVFINLEPIIRKLASRNVEEYMKVRTEEKSYEIISNFVNLASHYRLFFSKNKIYSKVYLIINFPFKAYYKNRIINPEYRKHYQHRFTKDSSISVFNNTLINAMPFVKLILEYVEGVYLINSNSLESSLIPRIITDEQKDDEVNFMLSTDKYDYQYANKGFYIIHPNKDNSYIIDRDNLIQSIKLENKIINNILVSPDLYTFIISLAGDKYRNIDKIRRIGLGSILKFIKKATDDNIISPTTTNINILSNIIKEEYRPLLLSNYFCIDVDQQFKLLNIQDIYSIKSQLVDKFDNVALQNINNQYFRHSPIYLMELTSGTNLKKSTKQNIFLGGN